MNALTRLLVPLVSIALSLGCESASAPRADGTALGPRVAVSLPDPTTAMAHEYFSGFGDPAQLVIADSWSWADTWAQLYTGLQPRPSLPAVDFRTERVVLVALGLRSHGGYDIRIDSVVRFERGSVTYVTTTAPGSRCFNFAALTQPVDLIRLSAPMGPMTFQQRSVVRDCS